MIYFILAFLVSIVCAIASYKIYSKSFLFDEGNKGDVLFGVGVSAVAGLLAGSMWPLTIICALLAAIVWFYIVYIEPQFSNGDKK